MSRTSLLSQLCSEGETTGWGMRPRVSEAPGPLAQHSLVLSVWLRFLPANLRQQPGRARLASAGERGTTPAVSWLERGRSSADEILRGLIKMGESISLLDLVTEVPEPLFWWWWGNMLQA